MKYKSLFLNSLTKEQIDEFKNLYVQDNKTLIQLKEIYQKDEKTMSRAIKELGIDIKRNKSRMIKPLTEQQIEEIKFCYTTETLNQFSKMYGRNRNIMSKNLKELKIEIKDNKFKQIYNIDNNFFEKIDTEEKAYWLGFLYADGNISKEEKYVNLNLNIDDIIHIEKFKNAIKSNHKIIIIRGKERLYPNGKKYTNKDTAMLRICCPKMAHDLINVGCIPIKSLILVYPNIEQVPLLLQNHFIRGYFDGDGCVSYNYESGNKKYNQINITGTKEFLENIKYFMNSNDYHIGISKSSNNIKNTYVLQISSRKGFIDFYNKIYKNSTIYLNRKYDKFQQFPK